MPLQRRVPKYGFNYANKVHYKNLNLDSLEAFIESKKLGTEITLEDLINAGVLSKSEKIKVLGRGELKSKISIEAHKFSKSAQNAIEKVGGSIKTV